VRLLLDTHVLLWWLADDRRLGKQARALIAAADNTIYVSAASAWEISIKRTLGKLKAPASLDSTIEDAGFEKLVIEFQHGERAGALPPLHNDPFDRMLIAQALTEELVLVTADKFFSGYGVQVAPALE
jgi:PIN domain nuclease of toxin-antitoxin system